jgi:uncharacterized membrane protein YqiK
MDYVLANWRVFAAVVAIIIVLLLYRWVLRLCGVIMVPDDSIGVVTKKFVLFGRHRRLPDGRIVALNGEAGFQADTLAPGLHVGLWPWQYTVEIVRFLTVPPGKVGCVETDDRCRAGGSWRARSPAIPSRTRARSSRATANAGRRWR